ncbi:hypothetical protein GALL_361190 [mine drainage metagenome]|uniref:Uncharacterized protein n=1 Tax=mine drainage metagenome TaxID=410659 RepID=A0A1J5QEZ6_9ZZZZ
MVRRLWMFGIASLLVSVCLPAQAVLDPDLPRQADPMVLGIVLDHTESDQNAFGIRLAPEDPDSTHPRMALCNHGKHEQLIIEFYERDTASVISELRVERVQTPHADCIVPPQHIERFMSGKGIHLGMSRKEVINILGKGYEEHAYPEEQIISYRIDDKDSPMLQRHNAPGYYGQYYFKANRLVRFEMGFDFP